MSTAVERAEREVKDLELYILKVARRLTEGQYDQSKVNHIVGNLSMDIDRLDAAKRRLRNERGRATREKRKGARR